MSIRSTRALSEAVAVLDPGTGVQNNPAFGNQSGADHQGSGRGLITEAEGLNAGDQVARREGVPSAVIFRRLDADQPGRHAPLPGPRCLQGRAGRTRYCVAASLGRAPWPRCWNGRSSRAGTVALAPASALLKAE